MDNEPQIGGRIKRLRRQKQLSQSQLAEAIGISASYLNLIEHNRRRITVALLFKLAGYFGVEPGELADNDESRLTGDLMELFGDDLFADSDLTNQDIRDLASSNPNAARAVVRLFDTYRQLSHGSATVSGADAAGTGYHQATEAISDFLQDRANYFPTLEAAAERIRADIDHASDVFSYGLKTYLFNVFGIEWRLGSLPHGVARRFDQDRRQLVIADTLPPESGVFAVAHQTGLMGAEQEIRDIIATSNLPDGDAPALARNVLASYFAAALIMPYEPFHRACRDTRYDIERIARRFNASFEQVCQRMTALQRPGLSGIPLHLVRTDIAGNISKRFSLSGIQIPRHSGACPRWNVYAAFLHPEQINIQISQMPEGQRYFCIAKAIVKGGYRHNAPRSYLSIGLGCNISHAHEMIYSDGVDLANPSQTVPIGVGCRICPRHECGQRALPPADHRFTLSEMDRPESLYARIG
ncbi:MAG: short-chain fatty acyl-CoA regulator family protein [Devosia sp.]|nr:short-chain fatty acyl-CoA regulator family protein [Devosia sp.]